MKPDSLPRRVLLVDDNRHIRRLLAQILEVKGYQVELEEDAMSALESIEANRPDLILCDGRMPEMDGWSLCAEVRRRFPLDRLPFVMITSMSKEELIGLSQQSGIDGYLIKPFRSAMLMQLIERLLGVSPHEYAHGEIMIYDCESVRLADVG
jgi:CheY-like chemotaxis protein